MKKYCISVFLFLCIFTFSINVVNALNADVKTWFIKKDEQGNIITNAEFEIYSLFGNNTIVVNNESIEGESLYSFINTDEVTYEKGLSFLNDEQKSIINGIKTINDYENVKSNIEKTYGTNEDFINYLDTSKGLIGEIVYVYVEIPGEENEGVVKVDYISIRALNFVVLEETKAPLGMERNKYIIPIEIAFYMVPDENGNLSTDEGQVVYLIRNNLIKYNSSVNYKNLKEAYTYFNNNLETINSDVKTGCDENYNDNGGMFPIATTLTVSNVGDGLGSACSHNPVIIDKIGTYNVNVTSYVNNSSSTNAIRHDTVTVKVKLENLGTVDSYNNVIVSHIPNEVTYVENTASDNGVYDEIEKTITWNVERLDPSDSKELTYDVIVPNNAKVNSNIIANASLNSDNVDEAIVSNNSTIRVKDMVNPKTGDLEKLGFVIALTIAFGALYILHGRNKFLNL